MEGALSLTKASSTKWERRSKSKSPQSTSTSHIVMAFLACLGWLYIAGRLWQDAENRVILSTLLLQNSAQNPKVLSVEDKLVILDCKQLERRIVEAETELTLAKSQGYLKKDFLRSDHSDRKLLAVIGVYTDFGGRLCRNIIRGSWMSKANALEKHQEREVVLRFVIGRSPNRGDSLDRNIDDENGRTKDFLILDGHEEAKGELPRKSKIFYSAAVQMWDAEFYVKVSDNVDLNIGGLLELLQSRHGQNNAYIGCMSSGKVVTERGQQWYEPEWWKFGDDNSYFQHAAGDVIVLSKSLAEYININSGSLKAYAHDDISIGSWMIGVNATYLDDTHLCCSYPPKDKVCWLV